MAAAEVPPPRDAKPKDALLGCAPGFNRGLKLTEAQRRAGAAELASVLGLDAPPDSECAAAIEDEASEVTPPPALRAAAYDDAEAGGDAGEAADSDAVAAALSAEAAANEADAAAEAGTCAEAEEAEEEEEELDPLGDEEEARGGPSGTAEAGAPFAVLDRSDTSDHSVAVPRPAIT